MTVTGATSSFTATEFNIGGGTNSSGINLVDSNGTNNIATFIDGGAGTFTLFRNLGPGTLVINNGSVQTGSGGATLFPDSVMQMVIHSAVSPMLVAEDIVISDSVLQVSFDETFLPFLGQIIPLVGYDSLTGQFAGIG